jgi:hypothetical protein
VGRHLWREDGSVFCTCCWSLPALRYETSLFVASYDSQCHGWGIRSRLHTGISAAESESYVTTNGQPASLSWNKAPIWSLRSDIHYFWQLRVCWFGAPSLTTGWVCPLQLQLTLTSAVIFGSESRTTRGHILLSQIRDFPFRRLLRLEGSRWRYSTPPPHGFSPSLLSLSLMLRPTVSRPVCLGIEHPSGAYDQIFIIVWQLRVFCCGAFSLTRGRVYRLQLLLALSSAVILWSESLATRDHILLSQIRDFYVINSFRISTFHHIVCVFQSRRMRWAGHVAYMREMKNS